MSIIDDFSDIATALKRIEQEKDPSNPYFIRHAACDFLKELKKNV